MGWNCAYCGGWGYCLLCRRPCLLCLPLLWVVGRWVSLVIAVRCRRRPVSPPAFSAVVSAHNWTLPTQSQWGWLWGGVGGTLPTLSGWGGTVPTVGGGGTAYSVAVAARHRRPPAVAARRRSVFAVESAHNFK